MVDFRENPPKEIAGSKVTEVKDYQEQTCLYLQENKREVMDEIPKSNVLIYYTEEGSKICIRPSGTEPKIKFYFSVKAKINSEADFKEKLVTLREKIEQIKKDLKL
jgi:phosphoglucomutase